MRLHAVFLLAVGCVCLHTGLNAAKDVSDDEKRFVVDVEEDMAAQIIDLKRLVHGYMAGTYFYDSGDGDGANYLCLSNSPQWDQSPRKVVVPCSHIKLCIRLSTPFCLPNS
ncbi:hypothetical protein DPMN_134836 [Dreissena polymorpha]|uniref:Uncharacterized protein n=1 Tax=Dreissena polymorpha TaxID=45954 RepID=A0A9D4FWX3_DREPO|nr:hypothetical protein DPMN_134836 [Dreissena polymorpha]